MPKSERLTYRRLGDRDLDEFHALATDPHIRRFLLDGQVMDHAWCAAEIERSRALHAEFGVGLWLALLDGVPIGFVGFRVFDELGPEPQLLYAFPEKHTGHGYATEAATAMLEFAHGELGWQEVLAGVDGPNVASLRVLERLGFGRTGEAPGAFGRTILLRHRASSS